MWDLLFKRYANPFDFIDGMDLMGAFDDALIHLIKEEQEEKLWSMYIHSMSGMSFKDWKKKAMGDKPQAIQAMTKEEVTTEIEKSRQILKLFH